MNKNFLLRCSTFLAIIFFSLGLTTRAHAQPAPAFPLLDDAYATLAQANHDYKGHRARAMKQIEAALHELGTGVSGHGHGREPQGTSDAQLRAAETLLEQAVPTLSGRSLKHVNNAINQINVALSIR
jgi:hypothetical protein